MPYRHPFKRAALVLVLAAIAGCGEESRQDDAISIGLLLSFTGQLAANSINSERALAMAIEAANEAGGVGGRVVRVIARDTGSDPNRVSAPARELVDAGVALVIGPDTPDNAIQLQSLLGNHTVILPSFTTAMGVTNKPDWWFLRGPSFARIACEIVAQVRADGRERPLMIVGGGGYNALLAEVLLRNYGVPQFLLPDRAPTTENVQPIVSAQADAHVLVAFPPSASSLVFALAAAGALQEGERWYLSPTLHTPAFLENIPKGVLMGARGVAPGTVAGAGEFRVRFNARWQDDPLDDAYPFYDAGAIAILALERAVSREGRIPEGMGLAPHVRAVTASGGTPVQWNELDRGLALLGEGKEVSYLGLSGPIEFDLSGLSPAAATKWWTIGPEGFMDIPAASDCR